MESASLLADVAAINNLDAVPTILDVISRATGMGYCFVARVTEDRWIVCAVKDSLGLGVAAGEELKVDATLCDGARGTRDPLVFEQASCDQIYRYHLTEIYKIESYVSVPIFKKDGEFFGVLCAVDTAPAHIDNTETIAMFELFANLIGSQLASTKHVSASEQALEDELENSATRKRLIAVLGHDLRNPLASIAAASYLIRRRTEVPKIVSLLLQIDRSVMRLSGIIANIVVLARERLDGRIELEIINHVDLEAVWLDIVDEIQSIRPEREIRCQISGLGRVACDPTQLSQILSNLLGNALIHGDETKPIIVTGSRSKDEIVLIVENGGPPIPESIRSQLFQLFYRTNESSATGRLGLGLFVASEIAKAHKGNITFTSDEFAARFSFTMPVSSTFAS